MTLAGQDSYAPRHVISSLCLFTVCAVLVATLSPFHSPKNQVSWVPDENAIRIGSYGTLLSSAAFRFPRSDGPACSIEIWFEPSLLWTRRTVLAFYDLSNPTAFSIHQDEANLVLQLGNRGEANRNSFQQMMVEGVFRKPRIFLTITSSGQETAIYVNGQLVAQERGFRLAERDLSGQLVLANSPMRNNNWSGKVRGLAIYTSVLTPSEVGQNYKDWTEGQELPLALSGRALAFYRFREHRGRIVHDAGRSGINLSIPERFLVVDQLLLEPPWSEVHNSDSYLRDCLINIEGFIPLGFVLTTHFSLVRRMKRPALAAVVVGGSLSAVVEVFQSYLPTRYSGCTDIITNTIGTALGAALYYRFAPNIRRRLAVYEQSMMGTVQSNH